MSLTHAANPGRHSIAVRKDDLYETPPEAVRALLRVESLPESVWEPACGRGSIVGILRATGHQVYATDLVDYGCPNSASGVDFLMERRLASRSAPSSPTRPISWPISSSLTRSRSVRA